MNHTLDVNDCPVQSHNNFQVDDDNERFDEDPEMAGMGPNTRAAYLASKARFKKYRADNQPVRLTDEEIERQIADCDNERRMQLMPEFTDEYCDDLHHGNPIAERAYRGAFAQSAVASLKLLLDPSVTADDIFDRVYDLVKDAKAARVTARESSDVGQHYGVYRRGHEVGASRTRGQSHGLISAVHLLESCEQIVPKREQTEPRKGESRDEFRARVDIESEQWYAMFPELTEEQFEAQQAAYLDRLRKHLAGYSAWVASVCKWASSDCSEVEIHGFYLESDPFEGTYSEWIAGGGQPTSSDWRDSVFYCNHYKDTTVAGKFPPELLNVPGFIGAFADHCNATAKRLQPELAMATGAALLATLCGRKLEDEYGGRCNLFLVLLAGTSSGKEHSRQVCKEILIRCLQPHAFAEAFASDVGLINSVDASPSLLALVDEFGKYLATQNGRQADSFLANIPTVLLRMFSSSSSVFVGNEKADKKRNPTVVIHNPNLNVLGTTVHGSFFNALQSENITDGLINRFLIFEVSEDLPPIRQVKKIPIPDSLIETAKQWTTFHPGSDLAEQCPVPAVVPEDAEAGAMFENFGKLCDAIATSGRSPICRGLWPRTYEKARKLALLYAASESVEAPRVGTAAASWGIGLATHCSEFVEKAAGDHISHNEADANRKAVLKVIREAGEIAQSDVINKTQQLNKSQRKDALEELAAGEWISSEFVKTNGKAKMVHKFLRA